MWVILFCFWIVLNGKVNGEIILLGAVMSTVVYLFLYKFMNLRPKKELVVCRNLWGIVKYMAFLAIEVIKANLATAKMILNFEEEPEPVLVAFHTDLQTGVGNTALANSITLTPGTITVDLDKHSGYVVHALDRSFAKGIDHCGFVEKLNAVEQKALADAEKTSEVRGEKNV